MEQFRNVKSKIKFLIDKDKEEKRMTEELQRQRNKIDRLERRQNEIAEQVVDNRRGLNSRSRKDYERGVK